MRICRFGPTERRHAAFRRPFVQAAMLEAHRRPAIVHIKHLPKTYAPAILLDQRPMADRRVTVEQCRQLLGRANIIGLEPFQPCPLKDRHDFRRIGPFGNERIAHRRDTSGEILTHARLPGLRDAQRHLRRDLQRAKLVQHFSQGLGSGHQQMAIADDRRQRRKLQQVGFGNRQHSPRVGPGDQIREPVAHGSGRAGCHGGAMTRCRGDRCRFARDAMDRDALFAQLAHDREADGIFQTQDERDGIAAHAGTNRCS